MEKAKKVVGSFPSSSSFTNDLFGPKEPTKSSLFGSIFGPPSKGLGKDSIHSGVRGLSRLQHLGNQSFGNAKCGTSENGSQRSRGDIKNAKYQNETPEPCHLSSSIYYGGQDVYYPTTQTFGYQNTFKKNGEDDDQNENNSNCASRGNWWQVKTSSFHGEDTGPLKAQNNVVPPMSTTSIFWILSLFCSLH